MTNDQNILFSAKRVGPIVRCFIVALLIAIPATGFAWEDLEQPSGVQTRGYRLYRAVNTVQGVGPSPFLCIAQRSAPNASGDADPPVGVVHYYLVTANNDDGDHSSPGTQSDGTPRVVVSTGDCNN